MLPPRHIGRPPAIVPRIARLRRGAADERGDLPPDRRQQPEARQHREQQIHMRDPFVNPRIHHRALLPQPGGEGSRVGRRDEAIPRAGDQQRWRGGGARVADRLADRIVGEAVEDPAIDRPGHRQEIIGPGEPDGAGECGFILPRSGEIVPLQGEHHREIGPGGMASDEHRPPVAAELPGIPPHEGGRPCGVVDEIRIAHLRIKPVIRDRHHQAEPRQRPADKGVFAPRAALPRPAIEKHHHRQLPHDRTGRAMDVETVARPLAIGDSAEADGAEARHDAVEQVGRAGKPGHQADMAGTSCPAISAGTAKSAALPSAAHAACPCCLRPPPAGAQPLARFMQSSHRSDRDTGAKTALPPPGSERVTHMIIRNLAAAAPPVAYAGGVASTSHPGFGAALQATLAGLQATQAGTSGMLQGIGPAQALQAAQQTLDGKQHHHTLTIPGLG